MFCVYKLEDCHLLITVCTVDKTQVHSAHNYSFNTTPIPGYVFNSVTLFFFHGEAAIVKRQFQLDVVEQEYT